MKTKIYSVLANSRIENIHNLVHDLNQALSDSGHCLCLIIDRGFVSIGGERIIALEGKTLDYIQMTLQGVVIGILKGKYGTARTLPGDIIPVSSDEMESCKKELQRPEPPSSC